MVRALAVCSSVLALWPSVAAAQGAECTHLRPTDPDAAWTYAGLPAKSFDTPEGHFRVWFVDSGAHAPALEASRPDGVPDVVAGVGAIAEAALSHFAELGYREPITDADYAACASNGGDGRLDVYLMNFGASDGTIVVERCAQAGAAEVCSGFSIVENDFSIGIASRAYASFEQAARTVVPHELFHLVQAAYDRDLDAFWTEGTAQWATKTLYPELRDLERFLPAYFAEPWRPLDAAAGGAARPFVYGAAIWAVYLAERFGYGAVREVFEQAAVSPGTTVEALEGVLSVRNTALGKEFPRFALWNAATGSRSASGSGYPAAADYPEVPTSPLGAETRGVLAGLGARYFHFAEAMPRRISIETDSARNAAWLVPLAGQRADLERAQELPAAATASALVVVAGRTAQKSDAPFVLRVEPIAIDAGSPDAADFDARDSDSAASAPGAPRAEAEGCSCRTPGSRTGSPGIFVPALAALLLAIRAFDQRRRTHDPCISPASFLGRLSRRVRVENRAGQDQPDTGRRGRYA